jgi:pimeloyl-ACP methyl ester carboxylesterase
MSYLVSQPVSLVLHDWGCMYGYMLERQHPELVKNVVSMDIGYHVQPDIVGWVLLVRLFGLIRAYARSCYK